MNSQAGENLQNRSRESDVDQRPPMMTVQEVDYNMQVSQLLSNNGKSNYPSNRFNGRNKSVTKGGNQPNSSDSTTKKKVISLNNQSSQTENGAKNGGGGEVQVETQTGKQNMLPQFETTSGNLRLSLDSELRSKNSIFQNPFHHTESEEPSNFPRHSSIYDAFSLFPQTHNAFPSQSPSSNLRSSHVKSDHNEDDRSF